MSSIGRIPKRRVGGWAREIIDCCTVSRQDRIYECENNRNWYYTGTADGTGSIYAKTTADVDRLASYLFSPVDPRYRMEFDRGTEDGEARAIADAGAAYLSREFQHRGVDATYADGVKWGLIESSSFVKLLWGRDGFDPWLVRQQFMGVFHEGVNDLDRQDAFVHTSFVTLGTFERAISGHPEEAEILRAVKRQSQTGIEDQPSGLKQLLIGGTIPVNLTPPQTSQPSGWVRWITGPRATLAPATLAELVQIDELWVIDQEREDYTTFQLVGEVVIEGKLQRRNLSGVKGHHAFLQICPNPQDGYFWGRAEVTDLMLPQEALNQQVNGINRVMRMQEDPPTTMQGVAGDHKEKRSALMKPGGLLAEINPTFKVENMAPKLDEGALPWLSDLDRFFDAASGFESPITRGAGEPGVRAGTHAETLVRMSTPRLRDRALGIERSYADLGHFGFEMLRVKVGERLEIKATIEGQQKTIAFTLSQIPDNYRITVDSHSASPAFSDEAYRKVLDLAKMKAINDVDLIRLTHPPAEDSLVANAEERHREQAQMLAQHPELLRKQSGRR